MKNEFTQNGAPPAGHSVRGNILFTFGILIALYLVWLLRDVLLLIYVSGLFAVVLLPVVQGIQRLRIGKWRPDHGTAILIIAVLLVGAIAGFLFLTIPPIVREMKSFIQALPGRSPVFFQKLQHLPLLRDIDFAALQNRLKQDTAQHLGTFVSSISDWATKIFEIVTGIILTVYFLAEGDHVYRWFLSMVPMQRRKRLDCTLQRAATRMGRWLLGQLLLMLILGVLSVIVFNAIHLRYAFVLAMLMGAFNIVPFVGAMISTALAMLVAAGDSWEKVLAVLVFELIYAQIENAYLTPRIMQSSVNLAGIAVFIALLLGGGLAGIPGVLVAVPSAVLIAVLIDEYVVLPANIPAEPERSPAAHR